MTCGDCIHYDVCFAANYNECSYNTIADGCKYFQNKADVQEVKQGEWIRSRKGLDGYNYECSECGEWALGDIDDYEVIASAHCPHCGARMDNEEQSKEV